LAITKPDYVDDLDCDLFPGGRNAQQRPLVCPANRLPGRYLVTLGDLIVNLNP
jgi:hypothetical protein